MGFVSEGTRRIVQIVKKSANFGSCVNETKGEWKEEEEEEDEDGKKSATFRKTADSDRLCIVIFIELFAFHDTI